MGRLPFVGLMGWLDISLSLQEHLLGMKTKIIRQGRQRGLLGLKGDFPAASLTSASDGEERTGNRKWSVCVIDCVLSTLLLLWYFPNLIIGAIMRWWESICIWTVSCSGSVSEGVPEETKATAVHMVWKGTPRSGSSMCGSANCCFVFFFFFLRILKGYLIICLVIANVTIIIINVLCFLGQQI